MPSTATSNSKPWRSRSSPARPSRMCFAHVYHHEANPVGEARVQLVEPRSGAVRHEAGVGTEDHQYRAALYEIYRRETASAQSREVEVGYAITWAGIIFTEIHVPKHEPQLEMVIAVALPGVWGFLGSFSLSHGQCSFDSTLAGSGIMDPSAITCASRATRWRAVSSRPSVLMSEKATSLSKVVSWAR